MLSRACSTFQEKTMLKIAVVAFKVALALIVAERAYAAGRKTVRYLKAPQ